MGEEPKIMDELMEVLRAEQLKSVLKPIPKPTVEDLANFILHHPIGE